MLLYCKNQVKDLVMQILAKKVLIFVNLLKMNYYGIDKKIFKIKTCL